MGDERLGIGLIIESTGIPHVLQEKTRAALSLRAFSEARGVVHLPMSEVSNRQRQSTG